MRPPPITTQSVMAELYLGGWDRRDGHGVEQVSLVSQTFVPIPYYALPTVFGLVFIRIHIGRAGHPRTELLRSDINPMPNVSKRRGEKSLILKLAEYADIPLQVELG